MPSRSPTATLNGMPVKSVEVHLSRTKKSDTFNAVVPLAFGNWWDADDIPAVVMMGNDGAPDVQMFEGMVDQVQPDWAAGTVTVSGRDKSKALVDKKSRKKFLNKKPGEIVQELAGSAGLGVEMDEIGDKAGKIYQIDWNKFLHDVSDWSLINHLADLFGMTAYVTGGTLYFKELGESLGGYTINYVPPTRESYADGSFIGLKGSRNLVLTKGAQVNVKSWNHKKKQVIEKSAGSGPLVYNYFFPGLEQSQADKIAAKKLSENTSHQRRLDIDMPGDTAFNARVNPTLSGTGTSFDMTYETESVEHRMSVDDGYRMSISAKTPGQQSE